MILLNKSSEFTTISSPCIITVLETDEIDFTLSVRGRESSPKFLPIIFEREFSPISIALSQLTDSCATIPFAILINSPF